MRKKLPSLPESRAGRACSHRLALIGLTQLGEPKLARLGGWPYHRKTVTRLGKVTLFFASHVNGSSSLVSKCRKSWLTQGSSDYRVTISPGTTFLNINWLIILCIFVLRKIRPVKWSVNRLSTKPTPVCVGQASFTICLPLHNAAPKPKIIRQHFSWYRLPTSWLGTAIGVPSFTTPASTVTPTTIGLRELKICWGRIRSLHGNTAICLNSSRFFCLSSYRKKKTIL